MDTGAEPQKFRVSRGAGVTDVQRQRIWIDKCDKELALLGKHRRELFTMNPYNQQETSPVTLPVVRREKKFLNKDIVAIKSFLKTHARLHPDGNSKSLPAILPPIDGVVKTLLDVRKRPMEKYAGPVTAAMEVGWEHLPVRSQRHDFANYFKKLSDITIHQARK